MRTDRPKVESVVLAVRIHKHEMETLQKAAKKKKLSVSNAVREVMLKWAAKQ